MSGKSHKWAVPYADLTTLLFVTFAALFFAMQKGVIKVDNISQSKSTTQASMVTENGIGAKAIEYNIGSDILFKTGGADLTPNAVLDRLAAAVIKENAYLRIEGHTDSAPINSEKYPSNWELSAARAINVLKYLESKGVPSTHLKAVGMADTKPISKDPQKNRRVVVMISLDPI